MVDNSELLLQRARQQWIAFAIFVDTHTVYISYLHYILNKTMLPSYEKKRMCQEKLEQKHAIVF